MSKTFRLHTEEYGVFDVLFPENDKKISWNEAKKSAKAIGKGYRLPFDFELEELFKSSLFRGLIKNASYWSGTETANTRARSQQYRNGGDFRALWYQNPGDIEDKDMLNYYFLVRKLKDNNFQNLLSQKILELVLYDSIRQKYHLNNYVTQGIDRSKIYTLYRDDNANKKNFLLLMKWGRIRPSNLNRLTNYTSKQLSSKLTQLNHLISKKSTCALIDEYLSSESLHIKGVGLSFITKHFHFVDPKKFIIYDRFMINLHVAMLADDDPSLIDCFFNTVGPNAGYNIKHKMHGSAYCDFMDRFKMLFDKLNAELSIRAIKKFKSLGSLEAFLFGDDSQNAYNPREVIKNYLLEFV